VREPSTLARHHIDGFARDVPEMTVSRMRARSLSWPRMTPLWASMYSWSFVISSVVGGRRESEAPVESCLRALCSLAISKRSRSAGVSTMSGLILRALCVRESRATIVNRPGGRDTEKASVASDVAGPLSQAREAAAPTHRA